MDALFSRNPGFRSRIGFTLEFPDYSPEEMLDIFKLMCRRAQLEREPLRYRFGSASRLDG